MRASELTEQLGEDIVPGPMPPVGSPVMLRALQIAASEVGVSEDPPGSNSGPRVNQYIVGTDGKGDWLLRLKPSERPWCARFVCWSIMRAVEDMGPLALDPLRGAGRGGGLASGLKWIRWARAAGALRMIARPGLVGVIKHDDGSSHVVLCWEILEGLQFVALEGNSRNKVRFVRRAITEVDHWIEVG